MFHVKHWAAKTPLLAYTKISEDHIEDILDIDAAGEPAECPRREPQLLGDKLFGSVAPQRQGASKCVGGLAQDVAMPLTRNQGWFAGGKNICRIIRQRRNQRIDTETSQRGN